MPRGVTTLSLSAAQWRGAADGHRAFLAALGAPDWHGPGLDALADSLRGGVNRVEPPLWLQIRDMSMAAPAAQDYVTALSVLCADLRADGVDVRLDCI